MTQCQNEVSYFEFLGWIEYLRQEEESEARRVTKQDYYLAQIAAMVVAANSKNPKKVKIQDFILKVDDTKRPNRKLTKEERVARAKAFWMRIPKTLPDNVKKRRKK